MMLTRVLVILFLVFSKTVFAADCPTKAKYLRDDLKTLWLMVEPYPNSTARDGIFTSWDYSKPFYELIRRSARRVDRTKGVFQELEDRYRYAYSYARRYPWNNSTISSQVELAYNDLYNLRWCYGAE